MKKFNGEILFLDRADINTDEIIPARYLTEITKAALKPYLLEDLEFEGLIRQKILPAKVLSSPGPISVAAPPGNMPPGH